MSRKPFVAGNWKMNMLRSDAEKLVNELKPLLEGIDSVDAAVCPTFTALGKVADALAGSKIMLGAQNIHTVEKDGAFAQNGAYTGELSAEMLKDACVSWVILGHSERRQYFGETDAGVNAKVKSCFAQSLKPIVCVGETLAERDLEQTNAVVEVQIRGCFAGIPADQAKECVIAYEPVWAIGTGRTATPQQAQDVHAHIRSVLASMYDKATADAIRIQYGGSMKPGNAAELLAQPDIDGGLIGGASLKAEDFAAIIKAGVK